MLELPEALTIARQINDTISGRTIKSVVAGYTPHKFTWYHGSPEDYNELLSGKKIEHARGCGGMVEIQTGSSIMLFSDGVRLHFHQPSENRPGKHQLLIELDDSSVLSATVQLYGGIWCFNDGTFNNPYYEVSKNKPSPLSDEFDSSYFSNLICPEDVQKLSIKAFLATEQRIPGLGNGVLQDILWNARIHPKRKVNTLSDDERVVLFDSIKKVLYEMANLGGRDAEKDLFGNSGKYKTLAGKTSKGLPCLVCGGNIKKENYMGGCIYYCGNCQTI